MRVSWLRWHVAVVSMYCSKREEADERRTRKRTSAGRDRGDTTVVEDVCARKGLEPAPYGTAR